MNLLIVNDEMLTADTMKEDIRWEKYGIDEVFVAYDAAAGKECIQKRRIDIMLCDIEMPGESGLGLLRWVRGQRFQIECVFLTCHASFDYAKEAIGLGCQDYILIPAEYEVIGKAIKKVADRIAETREAARYEEYGKYMLEEKERNQEDGRGKKSSKETAQLVSGYIIQHLGEPELSVNLLAEEFFFHPVYLNRIFKKEKGVSVSQFIINERMKAAASLLGEGKLGANQVAEKVGYRHYTNFHTMFKKYYGCSPSQYQERNMEGNE